MFRKNNDHEQEQLFSPVKELPPRVKSKLDSHWSSHFYEHVFTQIDEDKFDVLYDDGYSRPNKPVNELVSLEIIKNQRGLSDKQLEDAYLFDFQVRNALGSETLGDNICQRTFTNFRNRLLEFEEETGRDLLQEVFEEHRSYIQEEFDIDASTQRMDSTLIESNARRLSRVDLIATVIHNFLDDLPDEIVHELPAGMDEFADEDNLNLSYELEPEDVQPTIETLVEHAAWLVDHYGDEPEYTELESFEHLQRVLDEQCYRIAELEENDRDDNPDGDDHLPGDGESPGWEPVRSYGSDTEDSDASETSDESSDGQDRVGLKDSDNLSSDSIQNPHDPDATYRAKGGSSHNGYKGNIAETCGADNPFELITTVRVETNNTDDGDMLAEDIDKLPYETGLTDLLHDGGYTNRDVEEECQNHGVTQHFTDLTGHNPDEEKVSVTECEWNGTQMVACPAGHAPLVHRVRDSGRISGRISKEFCEGCPHKENCFVTEKQNFYSYGFSERHLVLERRRKRIDDPEEEEFFNLRAGAESMINEVYHQDGERTKYTGLRSVKNASIAKAIGTNLSRVSRHLQEAQAEQEPAG